jgi:hypothetical protein
MPFQFRNLCSLPSTSVKAQNRRVAGRPSQRVNATKRLGCTSQSLSRASPGIAAPWRLCHRLPLPKCVWLWCSSKINQTWTKGSGPLLLLKCSNTRYTLADRANPYSTVIIPYFGKRTIAKSTLDDYLHGIVVLPTSTVTSQHPCCGPWQKYSTRASQHSVATASDQYRTN